MIIGGFLRKSCVFVGGQPPKVWLKSHQSKFLLRGGFHHPVLSIRAVRQKVHFIEDLHRGKSTPTKESSRLRAARTAHRIVALMAPAKKTKARSWEDLTPPLADFILEYLRFNNFKTPTPVQQVRAYTGGPSMYIAANRRIGLFRVVWNQ